MKFFYTAIMALALFAFAGCGGSKSSALPATQNAPTFSAASVNDFVKSLSQYANDFVAAVKSKDAAQIAAAKNKFNETLAKAPSLTSALKPDEIAKLQTWATSLIQQTNEAAAAAAAPAPAAK